MASARKKSSARALEPSSLAWYLAWGAHIYTALGLVAAAGQAVLIVRGDHESLLWAFSLMVFSNFIDATDGTIARRTRVKEILPDFDGRRLDNLIDFLNYTFLPLLLMWRASLYPAGQAWWLLVPLVSSAYGFSQGAAKTDDGYFLGWPSYWNWVAFYLYFLRPSTGIELFFIVGCSFLTFVPSRYLYPSQPGRLNRLSTILGLAWGASLIWILYRKISGVPEDGAIAWSLWYPIYYFVASWAVTLQLWSR